MKASFVQNRISVSFLELGNTVNMVCRVKRQVDMLLMQKSMTVSARMEEPEEAIFLQVHAGCEALEGDFRDVLFDSIEIDAWEFVDSRLSGQSCDAPGECCSLSSLLNFSGDWRIKSKWVELTTQPCIQHGGSSTKLKDLNLFFFWSRWVAGWVGGSLGTSRNFELCFDLQACDLRHCRRANAWICERGATTEVWKNSLENSGFGVAIKVLSAWATSQLWRNARCHSDARHTGGDMCREVLQKMD